MMVKDFFHDWRKPKIIEGWHFEGDDSETGIDASSLIKQIPTKSSDIFNLVVEIQFTVRFKSFAPLGAQNLINERIKFRNQERFYLNSGHLSVQALGPFPKAWANF